MTSRRVPAGSGISDVTLIHVPASETWRVPA